MTIDFEKFKEDHPLIDVINSQMGVQATTDRKIQCLSPDHDDKNPSFQVYKDGGYKCFSCGIHGDLFDLLKLVYGWDHLEVINRLGELNIAPLPKRSRPAEPTVKLSLDPRLADQYHASLEPQHYTEWTKQGIQSDTLRHFKVGFNGRRYTFGWFYRGVLTAMKMRRSDMLYPDLEPKYTSMKGSRYATPYNIDSVILAEEPPDTIYIVEAEKCVLALYQCGYTGISIPASGWKKKWNIFLSMSKQVVIIPDNDQAGFNAVKSFLDVFPAAKVAKGHNRFSDEGEHIKDTADYLKAFGNLNFLKD